MKTLCWWITIICISMGILGCRRNADNWYQKAQEAIKNGNREEAIHCFTKALSLDPNHVWAHSYLGWVYKLEGKTDEAISEFKKAIELNPNLVGAHDHLGHLYLEKEMLDDAIGEFNKIIDSQPDMASAHFSLGVAYKRKGDLASAADSLFKAGLAAIVTNEKSIATNAYNTLKEIGNERLAGELHEVLSPWFDPAQEVDRQTG